VCVCVACADKRYSIICHNLSRNSIAHIEIYEFMHVDITYIIYIHIINTYYMYIHIIYTYYICIHTHNMIRCSAQEIRKASAHSVRTRIRLQVECTHAYVRQASAHSVHSLPSSVSVSLPLPPRSPCIHFSSSSLQLIDPPSLAPSNPLSLYPSLSYFALLN
jgi:hypothetical protein